MLYKNRICRLAVQEMEQMQAAHFGKVVPGQGVSVLLTFDQMFALDTSERGLSYRLAREAHTELTAKRMCDADDFYGSYNLMAHYGLALSGLFFAFRRATGALELHTSSISLLKDLARHNILAPGKAEVPLVQQLEEITAKLYGSDRIKKSVREGLKMYTVRLDQKVVGGRPKLVPVIPQKALVLSEVRIIPYTAMSLSMEMLRNAIQDKMLRIDMGGKVRVVTLDRGILNNVYGPARAEYLCSFLPDARLLQMYLPSVGASSSTAGVTNIKLHEIDSIDMVTLADVNLQDVRLDYSNAKSFFWKSVGKLGQAGLQEVTGKLVTDPEKTLEDVINGMYDRDVFDFMAADPAKFDMQAYRQLPPRFGSVNEVVQKPADVSGYNAMLSKGVYKVLLYNSRGSMSTVIATNDDECLAKVLGADYFGKYESKGVRVGKLRKQFETVPAVSLKDLEAMCLQAGCMDVFDAVKNAAVGGVVDSKVLIKAADDKAYEVDKKKTVVKQAHLVKVRNLEARIAADGKVVDYYKNIDPRSVVSVTRLAGSAQDMP